MAAKLVLVQSSHLEICCTRVLHIQRWHSSDISHKAGFADKLSKAIIAEGRCGADGAIAAQEAGNAHCCDRHAGAVQIMLLYLQSQ